MENRACVWSAFLLQHVFGDSIYLGLYYDIEGRCGGLLADWHWTKWSCDVQERIRVRHGILLASTVLLNSQQLGDLSARTSTLQERRPQNGSLARTMNFKIAPKVSHHRFLYPSYLRSYIHAALVLVQGLPFLHTFTAISKPRLSLLL
jgi:hypothetical protein